ncbi:Maf family protein [Sulfobacillus thermosulfidooxidans]|uniref:Maf family protein n=1 Tax=Sulfobacillus thermosulfidooxidans TaxID=28034 RepID=UPI00096BAF52|nr:Maf family protein [Sulfobacillus thermosulfidooxidans]OLZ10844.1 septum formation protein Maf [Sulfobacillus thermosulfidooxidans]OLZ14332.1 septum formation protein Maf [Sulfobacillus thermosulfidooxidans]OLZ19075.1 septum formation protein Maf [Sulfobacillus thermosulfidooxidans]
MARCYVLASSSPRRRELLAKVGLSFIVDAADIDETVRSSETPHDLVRRLAAQKAIVVGTRHPQCLIIGSDTVVAYQGRIFGKPRSMAHAQDMLRQLSDHRHHVFTAVAIWDPLWQRGYVQVDCTAITFNALSSSDIDAYLGTEEPWDKAGAYAIQGRAGEWIKELTGDVETVIGLPTRLVKKLLSHWDKERGV